MADDSVGGLGAGDAVTLTEFKRMGGVVEVGGPDGFGRFRGTAGAPHGYVFRGTGTHFVGCDDCETRADVTRFVKADLADGLVRCDEVDCDVCGDE